MFCSVCGSMITPCDGKFKCARCGTETNPSDKETFTDAMSRKISGTNPEFAGVKTCPGCGRGAYPIDGPAGTRFYTCTNKKCRRTWR